MASAEHDLRVINSLIETTIDSVDGYREAAREARIPTLRTLFERRASERQAVVAALQAFVEANGVAKRQSMVERAAPPLGRWQPEQFACR